MKHILALILSTVAAIAQPLTLSDAAFLNTSICDPAANEFSAKVGGISGDDRRALCGLVATIQTLGLWNNAIIIPMKPRQNIGSGTNVLTLGGLSTNTMSLQNTPTWTDNGIDFSGANQYGLINDFLSGGSALTVIIDTRRRFSSGAQLFYIAHWNSGTGQRSWALESEIGASAWSFVANPDGVSASSRYDFGTFSGGPGNPERIGFVFDGATKTGWQNGVKKTATLANGPGTSTLHNSTAAVTVSAAANPAVYSGETASMAVIFNVALTDAQFAAVDSAVARCTLTQPAQVWAKGDTSDGIGMNAYRIPSLIKTPTGRIIAFAEAYPSTIDTAAVYGIVHKYSLDGGFTWLNYTTNFVVPYDGTYSYGNPTTVISGSRIWLFFNRTNQGDTEAQIINGTSVGTRKVYVTYSDDDGVTWASILDITSSAKPAGNRWHACGPGAAIIADSGRIIVPYNSTDAATLNYAGVFYSDDAGSTWALGTQTTSEANEAAVVELPNGDIRLNCRRISTDPATNRLCFDSSNEGGSFGSGFAATQLIDPKADADIIKLSSGMLLFSNAANTTTRTAVTIRQSTDGTSWSKGFQVSYGSEFAAYSAMIEIDSGWVGCLWEAITNYERIFFTRVYIGSP